jgi:heme exporter protein C
MASIATPRLAENEASKGQSLTRAPLGLTALTVFTVLMVIAAAYMAFVYAPTERTMGAVQRIFYFHVGSAWAGAVGFLVTAVTGVFFLIRQNMTWDKLGFASAEVGLALLTMTLVSGPVWGQAVWGTPWTWDPKLTSVAVMWLSYAAYLMLREGIDNPARRARFSAVYGIVAFASVIMTYFGVRLIAATIHPVVIGPSAGTAEGDFGLTTRMVQSMLFSFLTFTFVYLTFLWYRIRMINLREYVDQLKSRALTD